VTGPSESNKQIRETKTDTIRGNKDQPHAEETKEPSSYLIQYIVLTYSNTIIIKKKKGYSNTNEWFIN
jgi:hypothetical protein